MTKKLGPAYLVAGVLMSALATAPAAAQFTGDTVHVTYNTPNLSSVYSDGGTKVVNPAASFTVFSGSINQTATVSGSSIVLNFSGSANKNNQDFNGIVLTDLTNSLITGVSLVSAVGISGFGAGDISFTSNSVAFDLSGLSVSPASVITANVSFKSLASATPEPGTWAMMIVGFGLAGYALRRRQKVATRIGFA